MAEQAPKTPEEFEQMKAQFKAGIMSITGNSPQAKFAEGGLLEEGGTIDPVSGNDVPVGSTQEEVRDDIPAQLSEGEFVFPADVVRYIGLENLMKLRQKAKKGLGTMEDMGQMGNSEEAVVEDDLEYIAQVDSLIDNFDPANPDSMEFAQGGVVNAQQGAYIPPQQFSYGYQPPQYVNAPPQQLPNYGQFISQPAQGVVGGTEQKQYIGPNGEMITIPFVNGKPQQQIPPGYKVYKVAEEKAPEVVKPTVDQGDDSAGEKEKADAEEKALGEYKNMATTLADYSTRFAEKWGVDPTNTGKIENPYTAIGKSMATYADITRAIEEIAKARDIDLTKFTQTGFAGLLEKYDAKQFAKELDAGMLEKTQNFSMGELKSKRAAEIAKRNAKPIDEEDPTDGRNWAGSDYSINAVSGERDYVGSGNDERDNTISGFDDPTSGSYGELAKGGLASRKIKTKRKPKMKRGGLASKK